jgi:very-short-patch-repair endonuclease
MKVEKPAPLNPSQPPLDRGGARSAVNYTSSAVSGEKQELRSTTPPLTRGEARAEVNSTFSAISGEKQGLRSTTPPLSRGGREGLGFIPYNKKLIPLARANRKNPTAAESKLWNEVLRMRHFADYKFSRQKPIANYIADFYCAALHLVIEIDGDSHAEAIAYDASRTNAMADFGITVIRYINADVLKNLSDVYDDLMSRIALLNDGLAQQ